METKTAINETAKAKALWDLWEAINQSFSSLRDEVDDLLWKTENEADFYDKEYLDKLREEVNQLQKSVYRLEFNIEDLGNAMDLTVQ